MLRVKSIRVRTGGTGWQKKPDCGNDPGCECLSPHAPADHCAVARSVLNQDQAYSEARFGSQTFRDASIDPASSILREVRSGSVQVYPHMS